MDKILTTLKNANPARKIKNEPIVNEDPKDAEINRLNKQIQDLELALAVQGSSINCLVEHAVHSEESHELHLTFRQMHELFKEAYDKLLEAKECIQQACAKFVESQLLDIQNNQKQSNAQSIVGKQNTDVNQENKDPNFASNSEMNAVHDIDKESQEYMFRQLEKVNQVKRINIGVEKKQDLMVGLLRDSLTLEEMKIHRKIKTLQAEREELLQTSQELSKTRRKEVQEIEKKIAELANECLKSYRSNGREEIRVQQVKVLTDEIQSLKKTRVELMCQLCFESDNYLKWLFSCEKEETKKLEIQTLMKKIDILKKERIAESKRRQTYVIQNPVVQQRLPYVIDPSNKEGSSASDEMTNQKKDLKIYKDRPEELERTKPLDKQAFDESEDTEWDFSIDDSFTDDDEEHNPDSKTTVKRDPDGKIQCSCKTTCIKMYCSCRKNDKMCVNSCNCDRSLCRNRKQVPKSELPPHRSTTMYLRSARYDVSEIIDDSM